MLFPALGFPPSSNRDRGLEGTRGNKKGKPGPTSTDRGTPAAHHDAADPAAQKGPSVHCDPPSTTKRPLGGTSAGQEPVPTRRGASSSGSGLSASPPGTFGSDEDNRTTVVSMLVRWWHGRGARALQAAAPVIC